MRGMELRAWSSEYDPMICQMKFLKKHAYFHQASMYHQVALNLMLGNLMDTGDPSLLAGDAVSPAELEKHIAQENEEPVIFSSYMLTQCLLYVLFGKHQKSADLTLKKGHDFYASSNFSHPTIPMYCFISGLSCFAAFAETKKKKYLKVAKIQQKKLKTWMDNGNPNVNHYVAFLEAESAACQKKAVAVDLYTTAIQQAAQDEQVHLAALASERLGEFHLNVMRKKDEATYRLDQSMHYYGQWGAVAKVQDIHSKYGKKLDLEMQLYL